MVSEFQTIRLETDDRGVARLTLNRPEARNAMSQEMIVELRRAVDQLAGDEAVRAVVLTGAGEIFCAGGDLKGMATQAAATRDDRIRDASELARMLADMNALPKPVIGRINGAAYGGGLGLISICDVAVGVTTAKFSLREVKLGLIPATISPYVVARIGVPNARAVMLNARDLDGVAAEKIGLLTSVVEPQNLDAAIEHEVSLILKCAPQAVAAAKKLIAFVSLHGTEENIPYTAERLADCWESAELAEGIDSFISKRKPNWHVGE